MTPKEFRLRLKAYNLRVVDRKFWIHLAAFNNFRATSTKPAGKNKQVPVYRRFEKFFDYKKELEAVDKKKESRFDGISKVMKHE